MLKVSFDILLDIQCICTYTPYITIITISIFMLVYVVCIAILVYLTG